MGGLPGNFRPRLCKNSFADAFQQRRVHFEQPAAQQKIRDVQAAMARSMPWAPMILIMRFML